MNNTAVFILSAVPEGRLFGLDSQTLISTIIQLINAIILMVVLGFILYKPVRNFLKNRSDKISGQIKSAQDKMADAEQLKAEYEEKFSEIESERLKILEDAEVEAQNNGALIIEDAKAEAIVIRKRAEDAIAAEKQRLKKETAQYIIEVSSLMAEKFVKGSMDSQTESKIFDEAIAELEEMQWLK
ncbi:MAG: ATP synthase F0 subunit B [Clostridia bacterium]